MSEVLISIVCLNMYLVSRPPWPWDPQLLQCHCVFGSASLKFHTLKVVAHGQPWNQRPPTRSQMYISPSPTILLRSSPKREPSDPLLKENPITSKGEPHHQHEL